MSIVIVLFGWIVQGATEEIFTRGWILQSISKKKSVPVAIIINSALFAFLHLLNPGISAVSFFNILLVGLLLSLMAIYYQNLWMVCGFHSSWNFFQGNIFGFEVSGVKPEGGSLFQFHTNGSDLFSGGSFGHEASLITTLIFIILTIYYYIKLKKNY